MQKLVLLTTVAVLIGSQINSAKAQWIVNDPPATLQAAVAWAKQQADMARQAANELRIIKQLYDNYVIAERTWNAVANARDIGGMMTALGGPTRMFLPEAAELVEGVGTGARILSGLSGAGGIRSANQIFMQMPRAARTLESGARWTEEMDAREITTANVQATANQALSSIQGRIANLGILQASVSMAPDLQALEATRAAIQIEQHNLALHNASLQALQIQMMAATQTQQTRQEQIAAQSSADWAAATAASVGMLQAGPN